MKRIMEGLKRSMEAAAFAEAGEFETAGEMIKDRKSVEKDRKSDEKVVVLHPGKTLSFSEKFDTVQEAITFSEAGDIDTARQIMKKFMSRRKDPKAQAGQEKKKILSDKVEKTTEAITFAEAGEHDYARDLIRSTVERQKILVVGSDNGFSDKLIHYAIGMASRMDYEIVALNVVPVGKRLIKVLNEKKVTDELKCEMDQGSERFRYMAESKGIPFKHSVKFGGFDRVVKEMHNEIKRISFVLAEPDHTSKDVDGVAAHIPVFSLTSG